MVSVGPYPAKDPTYYPIEETVGEDSLQRFIAELLRGAIDYFLRLRQKPTFVGADQFIYWVQHRPQKVVAPDVYILPGVPREARIPCLKTWEAGVVPSLAVEIVSSNDVDKDYRLAPERYDELGVTELVIFDPDARKSKDRLRFQVFRRVRGRFTRVAATNEDRVRSRVLGCWVRAVGKGDQTRLRLATGERGDDMVPTEVEAERARAEHERIRAEHERVRAEHERVRAEHERIRAEQAEAEIERLRAELGSLKKRS